MPVCSLLQQSRHKLDARDVRNVVVVADELDSREIVIICTGWVGVELRLIQK